MEITLLSQGKHKKHRNLCTYVPRSNQPTWLSSPVPMRVDNAHPPKKPPWTPPVSTSSPWPLLQWISSIITS
eukprot:3484357-Ditylum_brightwellii.AAC.1